MPRRKRKREAGLRRRSSPGEKVAGRAEAAGSRDNGEARCCAAAAVGWRGASRCRKGTAAPMAAAPSAPPVAAAAKAEEQKDWDVVPVFYGTDRAVEPNAQRLMFGSDRGRRLQLGQAFVTVPKGHQVPQVERPWAVKIPYFDVTHLRAGGGPQAAFHHQEIKALTKEQLPGAGARAAQAVSSTSRTTRSSSCTATTRPSTTRSTARRRSPTTSNSTAPPFLYSWPSGGGVASYTYDRESAQASEPYLRQFLEMVVKETGAKIDQHHRAQHGQPAVDGRPEAT